MQNILDRFWRSQPGLCTSFPFPLTRFLSSYCYWLFSPYKASAIYPVSLPHYPHNLSFLSIHSVFAIFRQPFGFQKTSVPCRESWDLIPLTNVLLRGRLPLQALCPPCRRRPFRRTIGLPLFQNWRQEPIFLGFFHQPCQPLPFS